MALSRKQLDELKTMVAARCAVLADEIRADTLRVRDESAAATVARGGMDSADAAAAEQIISTDGAELSRDLRELRELEAAQARFDAETFGQCVDCHQEIGYARLRAQPGALRCIDCQRRHEATLVQRANPNL